MKAPLYALILISIILNGCGSSSSDSSPESESESGSNSGDGSQNIPIDNVLNADFPIACYGFESEARTSERFPVLNIISFPAYEGIFETFDSSADLFGSFAILGASSNSVLTQALATIACDYERYADNRCAGLPGVTVENLSLEGSVLSWTQTPSEDGGLISVAINEPTYNSGEITVTEADGSSRTTQWNRDSAGTERMTTSASNGDQFDFTEYLDCSGAVNETIFEDGALTRTTAVQWVSPVDAELAITIQSCEYENGTEVCNSRP